MGSKVLARGVLQSPGALELVRVIGFVEDGGYLCLYSEPAANSTEDHGDPHDGSSDDLLRRALEYLRTLKLHRQARDLAAYGQVCIALHTKLPPLSSPPPAFLTTLDLPLETCSDLTQAPPPLEPPPWQSLLAQVARPDARGVQEGHWVTEDEMWARAERHAAMPPPPPPGAAPSSNGKWGR